MKLWKLNKDLYCFALNSSFQKIYQIFEKSLIKYVGIPILDKNDR